MWCDDRRADAGPRLKDCRAGWHPSGAVRPSREGRGHLYSEPAAMDEVDLRLVRALQDDGRLTFETLAGTVGLSRAAVRARVQRLLDTELVRIVGIVHPAVQGRTHCAHVAITVDGPAAPVARMVAELPESVFVTLAAGRFPVMAEVRTESFETLSATVAAIRALSGVRQVDTVAYTHVVKDPYIPPGDPEPLSLDETDRRVLEELQPRGRMPFAELADRIGLSPGAARARTLRLLNAGVLRVVALVRPGSLGLGHLAGFSASLAGDCEQIQRRIADQTETQFVAACLGRADVVGTVGAGSVTDVLAALEGLRALPGVHGVESWLHLEMVKERYDTHLLESRQALTG